MLGQFAVTLQLEKQAQRCQIVRPDGLEPFDGGPGRGQGFARVLDQLDISAPAFILLAGVLDGDQASFGHPAVIMVPELAQAKIHDTLLQPAEHSHTIIQQARITGGVDVAFHHGTVNARHPALFDLLLLGIIEHCVVDHFQALIRQGFDVFVEYRLFEALVGDADAAKASDALAVDQMKSQVLVGQPVEPHHDGRSENLLGAHAFCPGTATAITAFAKILQHPLADDRFAVEDARDGFQLLGLDVAGDFGHQGHLALPFFAHFVLVLFWAFVVLTVGWRLR